VDIEKRLGLNVRKLREAKGLSQEDFGFESGLHRTYVSDIERGTRNPTVRIVQRLADCLGVTPGSLLD
jgi:transcriptional regulator with XRE-family HTH domain